MVYTALDQFQIYIYIYTKHHYYSLYDCKVKELLNIEDGTNNKKQWEVKEVARTKSVSQFGIFFFFLLIHTQYIQYIHNTYNTIYFPYTNIDLFTFQRKFFFYFLFFILKKGKHITLSLSAREKYTVEEK